MDKIEKGPKEIFTPDIQKVSHRKVYKIIVPVSDITDAFEWVSESHMASRELFVEARERVEQVVQESEWVSESHMVSRELCVKAGEIVKHVVKERVFMWRKGCSWRDSWTSSM